MEQMVEHNKRLKLCVKWFQQVDENHGLEKEKLRSELESAEKKCSDTGNGILLAIFVFSLLLFCFVFLMCWEIWEIEGTKCRILFSCC